ncbi:hypothetical protein IWQ61_006080 [Dispira simplex]|nr:hypothetical protein IWQ61_006080 [Dispira simplex]
MAYLCVCEVTLMHPLRTRASNPQLDTFTHKPALEHNFEDRKGDLSGEFDHNKLGSTLFDKKSSSGISVEQE